MHHPSETEPTGKFHFKDGSTSTVLPQKIRSGAQGWEGTEPVFQTLRFLAIQYWILNILIPRFLEIYVSDLGSVPIRSPPAWRVEPLWYNFVKQRIRLFTSLRFEI